MNTGFPTSRMLILIALALWLAGCARSPAARFYTLNAINHQEAKPSAPLAANAVSVSIAPVEIPDYLERPEMVTRDGLNRLKLAEFDRWGGSLSNDIAAVLAENLAQLLGTDRIYLLPGGRGEKARYSLVMRVLRLDFVPGDQVLLKAQWTLVEWDGMDKKGVATRLKSFSQRVDGTSYQALAAAASGTLLQASREIAREIIYHCGQATSKPQPQVLR